MEKKENIQVQLTHIYDENKDFVFQTVHKGFATKFFYNAEGKAWAEVLKKNEDGTEEIIIKDADDSMVRNFVKTFIEKDL